MPRISALLRLRLSNCYLDMRISETLFAIIKVVKNYLHSLLEKNSLSQQRPLSASAINHLDIAMSASSSKRREQPAAIVFRTKSTTTQGRSLQSFLVSLSVAEAIFLAEILLFLVLRIKFSSV